MHTLTIVNKCLSRFDHAKRMIGIILALPSIQSLNSPLQLLQRTIDIKFHTHPLQDPDPVQQHKIRVRQSVSKVVSIVSVLSEPALMCSNELRQGFGHEFRGRVGDDLLNGCGTAETGGVEFQIDVEGDRFSESGFLRGCSEETKLLGQVLLRQEKKRRSLGDEIMNE